MKLVEERERLIEEWEAETTNIIGDSYAAIESAEQWEVLDEEP